MDANSQYSSLKGFDIFKRINPKSDIFESDRFHHVEFYTGEAIATYSRFMASLGMHLVAQSDFSTGNEVSASYVLQSGDMRMVFTAPYSASQQRESPATHPLPNYNTSFATHFITKHGLGVRAVAISVPDVLAAFNAMTPNGALTVLTPTRIIDQFGRGHADIAEVVLYGDTVLRLVNTQHFHGHFLPNFGDSNPLDCVGRFGLRRFDHIVGNVWSLKPHVNYIKRLSGFHEFAEFVAEDVGTVDSGLNSVVLANNNEFILLPLNEPTFGTKRKSQIQTYLEQFDGEGVQHMALSTDDIFATLRAMQEVAATGYGFTFLQPPPDQYYENLPDRVKDLGPLTADDLIEAKKLGILIDRDDQGLLLQIFTKPVGDRPTVFLEIIQRIGCQEDPQNPARPGCGGFGKGNFKDLFKSIEEYENTLGINAISSTEETLTPQPQPSS